jgi:hypothetical protein
VNAEELGVLDSDAIVHRVVLDQRNNLHVVCRSPVHDPRVDVLADLLKFVDTKKCPGCFYDTAS